MPRRNWVIILNVARAVALVLRPASMEHFLWMKAEGAFRLMLTNVGTVFYVSPHARRVFLRDMGIP